VTFAVYLFSFPLAHYLTGNLTVALIFKILAVSVCLYIYRRDLKFRITFDVLAVALGIAIFALWVLLDPFYPKTGPDVIYDYTSLDIALKLLTGVVLAPVVEEFFTRSFLLRWIIDKDWRKVKPGFTLPSFIITVLFFGFSHTRWLAGLLTGALLNLLYFKRKSIGPCIIAHAVANLALGFFVVYTQSFQFW